MKDVEESATRAQRISVTDLVALSNLPAAAVEQWGIITFQSAYLMYNKDETPFQLKLDSLKLLALKIAQQASFNVAQIGILFPPMACLKRVITISYNTRWYVQNLSF